MKRVLIVTILTFFASVATAQNFAYKVDFDFFFDNLEGSEPYAPTRTRIALKLAPEIGVRIADRHSLMGGAALIQDLGDSTMLTSADYILYYKYESKRFNAFAGAIPRKNTIGRYPRSFFREEFKFMDNNIEGTILQYKNKKKTGYTEFYVDWYGQNQKLRIDEFMLAGSTEYSFFKKSLIVGGAAFINHYKNEYVLADAGLYERIFYNVYVATDFARFLPALNTFRVGFGTLSSMEHKRYSDRSVPWDSNMGWQAEVEVDWKGLSLRNEFYFGAKQMIYYPQYGDNMYWGVQFYQAKRYNMTELAYSRSWKFLTIKGAFMLHATPGSMANQQMITLNFNLYQMFKGGKAINL